MSQAEAGQSALLVHLATQIPPLSRQTSLDEVQAEEAEQAWKQSRPFPTSPVGHVHVGAPLDWTEQVAPAPQVTFVQMVEDPMHVMPLPVKPDLQAHEAVPSLLVHVAFVLQPPLFVAQGLGTPCRSFRSPCSPRRTCRQPFRSEGCNSRSRCRAIVEARIGTHRHATCSRCAAVARWAPSVVGQALIRVLHITVPPAPRVHV